MSPPGETTKNTKYTKIDEGRFAYFGHFALKYPA
jgi:hypothetical protein